MPSEPDVPFTFSFPLLIVLLSARFGYTPEVRCFGLFSPYPSWADRPNLSTSTLGK
jgi:hypothetical protein